MPPNALRLSAKLNDYLARRAWMRPERTRPALTEEATIAKPAGRLLCEARGVADQFIRYH